MTPDTFHQLYKATGLSLGDLAKALNMRGQHAERQLREMVEGRRPVPGPTGVALGLLVERVSLRRTLNAVYREAAMANEVIRLNRDGQGQGRIKVATAMHRIAHLAADELGGTKIGS